MHDIPQIAREDPSYNPAEAARGSPAGRSSTCDMAGLCTAFGDLGEPLPPVVSIETRLAILAGVAISVVIGLFVWRIWIWLV